MSRRRSRSGSPAHYATNSNDPRDLERRIFVGNLPTTLMDRKDMEDLFSPYGKINDVNMAAEGRQNKAHSRQSPPRRNPYSGYGDGRDDRTRSRSPMHGRDSRDHRDGRDIREPGRDMRQPDRDMRQPDRDMRDPGRDMRDPGREMREPGRDMRDPGRDMREPGRDMREPGRDMRDPGREPRGGHPREHDPRDPNFDRYRGSEGREKDPRGEPAFRDEAYGRYYRVDDYYRKKGEPYTDRYRDPWNGRREAEEEQPRVSERRRNELYRQYYEQLQRQYDTERPVDCSVIVVNKQQKEYAETVGRKVRDLGMLVDLIFLNTEVSLTQALEDVGRAHTPFAIIITQQHQVHRSCTVNILFGTPQEHRNMPMQDAMVLVAHNYDSFKVEHRDKEREEIARKAAKMADDVLMREHEREGHPISLQPTITLLSESRYLTLEELDGLIEYLRDKRERLVQASGDPHTVSHTAAPAALEAPPPAQTLPSVPLSTHPSLTPHSTHTSHLPPTSASAPSTTSNHQQELQAKILSLFNSGSGASTAPAQGYSASLGSQVAPLSSTSAPAMAKMPSQPPAAAPSMLSSRPALRAAAVPTGVAALFGAPASRIAPPQLSARPAASGAGINFDNPSVQKALDTLIQSGPALNHLVNPGNPSGPRPSLGLSQPSPMAHYARHY